MSSAREEAESLAERLEAAGEAGAVYRHNDAAWALGRAAPSSASRSLVPEAAALLRRLAGEKAHDPRWPPHEWASVSGALMDAHDLAGDLTPSAAIRLLTAERDAARGLLREAVAGLRLICAVKAEEVEHPSDYSIYSSIAVQCKDLARAVLARIDKEG